MSLDTAIPDRFRLRVLPPRSLVGNNVLPAAAIGLAEYEERMAEIQRLRGAIYVADGAIPASALDGEKRHICVLDVLNWHLFVTGESDEVCACLRLRLHEIGVAVENLQVYQLVGRMEPTASGAYTAALAAFVRKAESLGMQVGEVGGWAVAPEARNCAGTMALPFAGWSLYQAIGNVLALSAATSRHRSASILKRIGGSPLLGKDGILPSFFDPSYGCDMEILGYDSRHPSPKYAALVEEIRRYLLGSVAEAA